VLEFNYDLDMLRQGPYPASLKARIESDVGHLSNAQSLQLLKAIDRSRLKQVVAAHLSQTNNRRTWREKRSPAWVCRPRWSATWRTRRSDWTGRSSHGRERSKKKAGETPALLESVMLTSSFPSTHRPAPELHPWQPRPEEPERGPGRPRVREPEAERACHIQPTSQPTTTRGLTVSS